MSSLLELWLPGRVEYACLFFTRVAALISTAPIFATATPWGGYRLALAAAITAVALPAVGAPDWNGPAFGFALVPLVARELIVGTFLGFVVVAAFAAVRGAGELVGAEMGLSMSALLDPTTGRVTPVVATLYQTIAGLIFLAVGAHRWVVAGLARSFERIPVGTFEIGPDPATGVVQLLRGLFEAGITLGAPVLVAMFLVTVVMGLLSRAVPQLNVLDVGFALRVALALGALICLLPALRIGIEALLEHLKVQLVEALPATRS